MAKTTVPHRCDAERLAGLLDTPEVASLVAELEATRWTGRPGYPARPRWVVVRRMIRRRLSSSRVRAACGRRTLTEPRPGGGGSWIPRPEVTESPFVKAGKAGPPSCEHGTWTFAGSDAKRGASKYRCPSGECSPASVWIKADRLHTLIPRETARWKSLYRGRAAVEREFGRLKHEWALLPLRVRRIERVRLHADLTILSRLAVALAKARAVPLAA